MRTFRTAFPIVAAALAASPSLAQTPAPSQPLKGLSYDADFFPGSPHNPAVPTPDSVLGFRLGDKPVSHAQVEAVIKAIAAAAPARVKLFEYAVSHEGRKLYYLAVSSEANITRLDAIKADAAKLGDPRAISKSDADSLAGNTPAIAWMAYVIHGNEMSGTDASLALLWHLASGTGEDVKGLLGNLVVLIDPLMNPDGRDRCITNIRQNRTAQPAVDDQAIIHAETWPGGRTNHYHFDMNRDWVWGTQPESRGRIKAAGEWNPHYFVESHEQGSQDTFLFMPPRAPINPNIPESIHKWSVVFGEEQGKAFDAQGWRYYTGEWNEEWYPGYSGSWAALRGAIDNLYEQASLITDGVRRYDGTIEAYREAVHKQLVSSMANLTTLKNRKAEVVKDFVEERRKTLEAPERLFVIEPRPSLSRGLALVDMLELQGIEVYSLAKAATMSGRDWLGRELKDRAFPEGTLVVPARQPQGRLAAALLELDPRMSPEFLTEERRELLRFGQSRLYDITGWNAAMMFGIPVYEINAGLPAGTPRADLSALRAAPVSAAEEGWVALAMDGNDDRAPAVAARLMDQGVRVRALNKPTVFSSGTVARGTFFITRVDNRLFTSDLAQTVIKTATEFGVPVRSLKSGMGPGDAPDLGGQHFVLLEAPRVAVLTHGQTGAYSVGQAWHLLDHRMGMRVSMLVASDLGNMDLRRYNVLVIPDGGPDGWADKIPAIKTWVEAGGTLIALGGAAAPFTKDKDGIGSTRQLPDVLTKLEDFRAAIVRDWLGKTTAPDPAVVWSNNPPDKLEYPWTLGEAEKAGDDEVKRRDQWRSLFMPQGAILATRTDDRHWITAGCGDVLPVIYGSGPVLIPAQGGNAPVLMGTIVPSTKPPAPPEAAKPADKKEEPKKDDVKKEDGKKGDEKKDEPKPGWLLAPPGQELRLRMSGLLWPEAADRISHSAYCTQERVGNGQVILFAADPNFRGAARGSERLFINAVVCGPGMGASQPIRP